MEKIVIVRSAAKHQLAALEKYYKQVSNIIPNPPQTTPSDCSTYSNHTDISLVVPA